MDEICPNDGYCCCPLASAAAPAIQRDAIEACGDLPQAGMRACLARKAVDSYAALERAEDNALAVLRQWDEDARHAKRAEEKLDASNKAFARYREAQCAFAASLGGGAIASALDMRRQACIIDLNEKRVESLSSSVAALPRR